MSIASVDINSIPETVTDGPAWKTKPIKQDVVYNDAQAVQSALVQLEKLPPLVTTQEVRFSYSCSLLTASPLRWTESEFWW